jgi:hypothetical protein
LMTKLVARGFFLAQAGGGISWILWELSCLRYLARRKTAKKIPRLGAVGLYSHHGWSDGRLSWSERGNGGFFSTRWEQLQGAVVIRNYSLKGNASSFQQDSKAAMEPCRVSKVSNDSSMAWVGWTRHAVIGCFMKRGDEVGVARDVCLSNPSMHDIGGMLGFNNTLLNMSLSAARKG